MDTVSVVDTQIEEGQRLLDRLDEIRFPVQSAGWLKLVEADRWSLYIASPAREQEGPLAAYRRINDALRSLGEGPISSSDIELIGLEHPIARAMFELQRKFAGRFPALFRLNPEGSPPIEEAYLYSPLENKITVYGLIFRGDPMHALHLSLRPHDTHGKLTIGSGNQAREYSSETGIDWVIGVPLNAELKRDNLGRTVLSWDLRARRVEATADDVLSFARFGLHGFRILKAPDDERFATPGSG